VPLAEIPDYIYALARGGGTDKQSANAKTFVQSVQQMVTRVKRDEQEGIVWPRGFDEKGNELYKFSLISSGGSRAIDTVQVINRLKQQLAGMLMADVLLMGHEEVGSYALGETKMGMLYMGVESIVGNFCRGMNRHAIPQLFELNGEMEGPYPELEHASIEKPDLAKLGAFGMALTTMGIDLTDPDTEQRLREAASLDVKQTEDEGENDSRGSDRKDRVHGDKGTVPRGGVAEGAGVEAPASGASGDRLPDGGADSEATRPQS
jgi:hypothetical protein